MKASHGRIGLGLAFLLLVTGRSPGAESDPDLVPPRPHPNVEQLRERAAKMSPEERQRFIRELQERRGLTGTNRPEAAVRREEFRKLTPEERAARVREFRQRLEKGQPRYHVMTPEEREAKRVEVKQRVDRQIETLKAKQTAGTITDLERRRLERMETMSKRLGTGQTLGPKPGTDQ